MDALEKFIVFHPKIIIAATLVATAGLAAVILARGLSFNGAPETLTRNDDELRFFHQIRSSFGDDRVIIVALTTSDVFTGEFIERLDRLTVRLGALDDVAEALSLTNIKAVRRERGEIIIEKLIPRSASEDRLRNLKQAITQDTLYSRHYISEDGKTAAISIFIEPSGEADSRRIVEEVERVARSEAAGDELLIAGVPVIDARAIKSMVLDMAVLSPIAALLCFSVFFLAFRTFWGAALPMAALVIGLIWTIGLMRLFDRPITFATLPLPTTLLAIGSSYFFHVLNQYRISMSALDEQADAQARRSAWLGGLKFIGPAVLVSGTATMAGFGSLASSSIPTVRDMGLFEALGALFMLVLSLAFIPSVLAMLSAHALGRTDSHQKDYAVWLNDLLRNITALILFRRRAVLIASIAATLLIGAGVLWLRVNTDYLKIFPRKSETVQAAEKLHERLAGAATIQVVVSGAKDAVAEPNFLKAVASLEEFALNQPGVDASISIAGIIKRFNSVFSTAPNPAEEIPQDRAHLKAIFDDYLFQDESVFHLVSRDLSRAVIVLRTNLFGSNDLRNLTDKINEWSRAHLPAGFSARATGSPVLLNSASDAVATSQASSLAIALISIYLMMVVLFRSFSTALLALIPNLLPIICYFGFLGLTATSLDITTSLVASAALGLAVDNAVHMIRRYRQSVAERSRFSRTSGSATDEGWAMWLTMLRTGKPMVLANVMLIAAFLIFMLSSFVPVRIAGLLWAVTIFVCLVADLIFLPALMKSKPFARAASGDSLKGGERRYSDVQGVVR